MNRNLILAGVVVVGLAGCAQPCVAAPTPAQEAAIDQIVHYCDQETGNDPAAYSGCLARMQGQIAMPAYHPPAYEPTAPVYLPSAPVQSSGCNPQEAVALVGMGGVLMPGTPNGAANAYLAACGATPAPTYYAPSRP